MNVLCEQCKTREANVVIREVVNGVQTQRNLCSQCAAETELGMFLDGDSSFSRLLSGILGLRTGEEEKEAESLERMSCPTCHTTYRDFVQNSLFGCADCYSTFGLLLENNIKKLQGSDEHTGKHPKYAGESSVHHLEVKKEQERISTAEQLEILQAKLKEAIEDEEYESAARYRDEIRSLRERTDEKA